MFYEDQARKVLCEVTSFFPLSSEVEINQMADSVSAISFVKQILPVT